MRYEVQTFNHKKARFFEAYKRLSFPVFLIACGRGVGRLIGLSRVWAHIEWITYRFGQPRFFSCDGVQLRYFYHPYHTTWKNERAIEIPIVQHLLEPYQGKRMLEVGNVLSYYGITGREVLDKYEKGARVINEDILSFVPAHPYEVIVSISTLEHIGRDDDPEHPEKVLEAFQKLTTLLAPEGMFIVTIPLGYHLVLDQMIREEKIRFDTMLCFKRVSEDNRWEQKSWEEIQYSAYKKPYPAANGLIVGVWKSEFDAVNKK